jgi:glycosyltransferase involved in cell wall biosynthesis
MHILMDCRGLGNQIDGIGQYTNGIIRNLPDCQDTFFTLIINKSLNSSLPQANNIKYIASSIERYRFSENSEVQAIIRRISPDLYFNTSPYVPGRLECPSFFVLHDLLNITFKGHFSGMSAIKRCLARLYFRYVTSKSIRLAKGVITVSDYSKKKIIKYYNISPEAIKVVYEAADSSYNPIDHQPALDSFRSKHGLPEHFMLHVGNLKPYKNISNILFAFREFKTNFPDSDLKLVFTNKAGRGYTTTLELIKKLQLEGHVILFDYFVPAEMPFLYHLSKGLFFPSLEEGFGLPIIEAMCCKTPVVTSLGTATEEISNGQAFLVDPTSIQSLVKGIKYLENRQATPVMIEKAYAYAKSLSWRKTTDEIINHLRSSVTT